MRRTIAALAAVAGIGVAGVAVSAAGDAQPARDLEYVVVEAGDTYYSIGAEHGSAGGCLWDSHGRDPLFPNSVVYLYPHCEVQTAPPVTTSPTTTTTVAPPSTDPPATTTTTTTAPPVSGFAYENTFDTQADFDELFVDVYRRNWDQIAPSGSFNPGEYRDGRTWLADHSDLGGGQCGSPYDTRTLTYEQSMTTAEVVDLMSYWCDVPPEAVEANHWMASVYDVDNFTIMAFGPDQSFDEITSMCMDVNLTDTGSRLWIKAVIVTEELFGSQVVGPKGGEPVEGYYRSDIGSSNLVTSMSDDSFLAASWGGGVSGGYSGAPGLGIGDNGPSGVFVDQGDTEVALRQEMCLTDNGDGTVTFQVGDAEITQPAVWPTSETGYRALWLVQNYTDHKDPRENNTGTFHIDDITVT